MTVKTARITDLDRIELFVSDVLSQFKEEQRKGNAATAAGFIKVDMRREFARNPHLSELRNTRHNRVHHIINDILCDRLLCQEMGMWAFVEHDSPYSAFVALPKNDQDVLVVGTKRGTSELEVSVQHSIPNSDLDDDDNAPETDGDDENDGEYADEEDEENSAPSSFYPTRKAAKEAGADGLAGKIGSLIVQTGDKARAEVCAALNLGTESSDAQILDAVGKSALNGSASVRMHNFPHLDSAEDRATVCAVLGLPATATDDEIRARLNAASN